MGGYRELAPAVGRSRSFGDGLRLRALEVFSGSHAHNFVNKLFSHFALAELSADILAAAVLHDNSQPADENTTFLPLVPQALHAMVLICRHLDMSSSGPSEQ